MTPEFDEGVVLRKGLVGLAVREETGRRWWAVRCRLIGRGSGWRDERIMRETHDATIRRRRVFGGA